MVPHETIRTSFPEVIDQIAPSNAASFLRLGNVTRSAIWFSIVDAARAVIESMEKSTAWRDH